MKRRMFLSLSMALAALLIAAGAPAAPPKGLAVLRLPKSKEGLAVELTLKDGTKLTVTSKGVVVRPGAYDVKSLVILKQDSRKNTWMLVAEDLGSMGWFSVDPDQDKVIDPGTPIIVCMQAWWESEAKGVHLTLETTGSDGERYIPNATAAGKQPALNVPFQIVDEDGKRILATGNLSYKQGYAQADWHPPAGYQGKFTVQIKPEMGPFEWKYIEEYAGLADRPEPPEPAPAQ